MWIFLSLKHPSTWVNASSNLRLFFIAAEGYLDYCCQTFTGSKFTFRVSLFHFPLPFWITKYRLSLQVLLERIRINYYSSALNMVTAPVSSTVYSVTTFSDLLSNWGFFFSAPEKTSFLCDQPVREQNSFPFLVLNLPSLFSCQLNYILIYRDQCEITYIFLGCSKDKDTFCTSAN